ncbi:MAG: hypothetical protein HZB81_07660 [Deltaproteobacteria bacterium]|nr:hypothetical protein [Deltaproteobacteria bacterium]MBI5875698.1 hypothetical protein [Deltaproteobacteria bacterium]
MLVANNQKGNRCKAWLTEKPECPFYCPKCQEAVILKKGRIKAHHFAHKPPVTCQYGTGESQKHWKAKKAIYEALVDHPHCKKCDLERMLDGVRPDVSLYINNVPVAIEFQNSTIEIEEIKRRAHRYLQLGIHLIWLMPECKPSGFKEADDGKKTIYRPQIWQKYLQNMYYGRLYYWQEGAIVSPVHLLPYKHYVERGNWVDDFYDESGEDLEGTNWHEEHYYDADYGGYHKMSKTKKEVIYPENNTDRLLHIADDFRPAETKPFTAKNWHIPKSLIWLDRLKKWW